MAEDTTPITTTVPETVSVDTGADKEVIASLESSFDDFWKEQDSETPSTAPAAPGDEGAGAAQETKETPAAESKPDAAAPARGTISELTDDEIDRIQLPPASRPEHISEFKELKSLWKADRARMRAETAEKQKIEAELAQARQNAWTPEQKADYEHAASVRRRFDAASDPEFLQRYHMPVQQRFESVLEEAVEALPDKQAARAWADYIKSNYRPDQLDRDWWLHDVAAKVPDELERTQLLNSVGQLRQLQKERDSELQQRTKDKSSFENWITEKVQTTSKRVQDEIMTEIGEQEKRIAEILPRNIDEAKTSEERKAIEAHNERFQRLNGQFQGYMKDISANGPRAWVRASIEATRAQILDEGLKQLQADFKNIKAERDRYKAELEKITGARRRMSQTAGTPPASSAKKNDLSIRDLDVRKAFDSYSWGDEGK